MVAMWCVHHRLIYHAPHVQAAKSNADPKRSPGPGRPRREDTEDAATAFFEDLFGSDDPWDEEDEGVPSTEPNTPRAATVAPTPPPARASTQVHVCSAPHSFP